MCLELASDQDGYVWLCRAALKGSDPYQLNKLPFASRDRRGAESFNRSTAAYAVREPADGCLAACTIRRRSTNEGYHNRQMVSKPLNRLADELLARLKAQASQCDGAFDVQSLFNIICMFTLVSKFVVCVIRTILAGARILFLISIADSAHIRRPLSITAPPTTRQHPRLAQTFG